MLSLRQRSVFHDAGVLGHRCAEWLPSGCAHVCGNFAPTSWRTFHFGFSKHQCLQISVQVSKLQGSHPCAHLFACRAQCLALKLWLLTPWRQNTKTTLPHSSSQAICARTVFSRSLVGMSWVSRFCSLALAREHDAHEKVWTECSTFACVCVFRQSLQLKLGPAECLARRTSLKGTPS